MEIKLASKRKLGFVDGSVTKSTTDETEAAQWETCNNMVISWIHNNISDAVKMSILLINYASEVWKQLERRFILTNGSRKYKFIKDLFSLKQNEFSIAIYYTAMSSMTVLPRVTVVSEEITALLKAIDIMKEESHLFQFLNGLNEVSGAQRSQLLMMSPLPAVEGACASLQQEDSQRDALLLSGGSENEMAVMYSKGPHEKSSVNVCIACGVKWHSSAKCWTVHGYPRWHYKHNRAGSKNNANGGKWSGEKIKISKCGSSNWRG
ncbi:uncharacterized protein LOC141685074 [Apium graveolens]|uniref:uncharacterized protein LOC141685074 n=1 Tax=Apium graveolens TaxID=4045 RepID=UPI003D795F7D